MPPSKCPECGRFLKRALVESLTTDPTPCPRCETGLVAEMFPEEHSVRPPDLGTGPATPAAAEPPAPPAGAEPGSVRPPDLVPVMVRDEPRDVLEGWDQGADPAELVAWRDDRPPFPTDAAVVVGAGAVGALVGALVPDHRGRNALIGGLVGVVGAAVARRIWRLEP